MSKLKIAYFGDGPWAHKALKTLAERRDDFEIVFVAPRYDHQDPELCRIANQRGLEIKIFENVNAEHTIEDIRAYQIDLVVSMSFNQIFKEPFLGLPSIGSVNCHAGALPRYRGRNVLNWALINGENEFGVTAHFIDTGIDTGDILHQEMVPIVKGAKYADLLELAYEACPRVLISALDKLREGTAVAQSQPELGVGFYCGLRVVGDEWIDWSWSAERIVNFVRAISLPGPGAVTALGGQMIRVYEASFNTDHPEYICTEGEVVGRDNTGVWIKASDTVVKLECCQSFDSRKMLTPQWRIGSRLTSKQDYRLSLLEIKSEEKF